MPPFGGALFRSTGPCSSTIVRPAAKSVLRSCTHSVLPGHIHPWCVSANESVRLRVLLKREKKCRSALKTDNSPRGGLSRSLLRNQFLFHTHKKKVKIKTNTGGGLFFCQLLLCSWFDLLFRKLSDAEAKK